MVFQLGIPRRRSSHAVMETWVFVRRASKASSRYCISPMACIAWSEAHHFPMGVWHIQYTIRSVCFRFLVPSR